MGAHNGREYNCLWKFSEVDGIRAAHYTPTPKHYAFSEWANAFDLLKVYGAGWFGEAGMRSDEIPHSSDWSCVKKIMDMC